MALKRRLEDRHRVVGAADLGEGLEVYCNPRLELAPVKTASESDVSGPAQAPAEPIPGCGLCTAASSPEKDGCPRCSVGLKPGVRPLDLTKPMTEGCLSLPGAEAEVRRQPRVRLTYMNRNWTQRVLDCEGLLAQVVQHEVDHLEGKLYIDHLKPSLRGNIIGAQMKARRGGGYRAPGRRFR